ncbi:MAG: ATP-binding cassette domain-containing protein [Chordicoccus sp.]
MLQIRDIRKQYKTGGYVQQALGGVSLNLRDNEFVAILGPSGSGKTTLLNIIGGLDRYDSGDLIINGVSTKKYKDRDWDSYRNHTIGFVFQSYNLIMHQTVLSNVELALTISGISGAERQRRAEEALRKVGLGEQMHKKPNQMSGGQMQRVAIARALVNDPDIVLADEPTGALDSDTSVQVMDLLKEVAKDRLVVMVTHNPELAKQYATRIVSIRDGKIEFDSDPYMPEETEAAPVHKNLGRASMSFLTALHLSFNNLKTKKARTLLVAFAGSIGIIGIALILSLSNGVNHSIATQEEETLSEYPLQIERTGYDLSSLMSGMNGSDSGGTESTKSGSVGVTDIASSFFQKMSSNDLASLKTYLDSGKSGIGRYVNAIEYTYDITPQIFRKSIVKDGSTAYTQVSPNKVFQNALSDFTGDQVTSFMSNAMSSDIFYALPKNANLYEGQYTVKAGHWPKNDRELVLVLDSGGCVSDITLYALGLRDESELTALMKGYVQNLTGSGSSQAASASQTSSTESVTSDTDDTALSYSDFIGLTFKLVKNSSYYTYDSEYGVYTDKSDNDAYVQSLADNGEDLTIVGIVQPKSTTGAAMLNSGVNYPHSLIDSLIKENADSDVVKAQLKTPATNVLTGKSFGTEDNADTLDMSKLFTVNTDAIQKAFTADMSKVDLSSIDSSQLSDAFSNIDLGSMDLGSLIDPSTLASALPSADSLDVGDLLSGVKLNVTQSDLETLFRKILSGYQAYSAQDPSTDYSKLSDAFAQYLNSDDAKQLIRDQVISIVKEKADGLISTDDITSMLETIMNGYEQYVTDNNLDPSAFTENLKKYLADETTQKAISDAAATMIGKFQNIEISSDDINGLVSALASGYATYAEANSLPDPTKLTQSFASYLSSSEVQTMLTESAASMIDTSALEAKLESELSSAMNSLASALSTQVGNAMKTVIASVSAQLEKTISAAMTNYMNSLQSSLSGMFQIDPNTFASAISMNMSADEIKDLLSSLMSGGSDTTYESNLADFGYADTANPSEISIYPKDFASKDSVTGILDSYNKKMKDAGEDDKVITYTDMVGTMMSSVTRIVNMITYVLIAFVAISLVVSSIMIGVITYISVLERRKEIGILRAIGASKHNIAQVFNAETFITGLLAGMIGIGMTLLLIPVVNSVIRHLSQGMTVTAALPVPAALALIALSVALTLLSGLIPARKASKSDPVTALRTD